MAPTKKPGEKSGKCILIMYNLYYHVLPRAVVLDLIRVFY